MQRIPITLNVNGEGYPLEVEPQRTLLEVLREDLALTGTKSNCLAGECGACTVIVDGRAINACLYLAVRADGKQVTTVEGLAGPEGLHVAQEAFIRHAGVQCGYCTPGFIMSAVALLEANPQPTEAEMLAAVAGNICRCTGYTGIRRALSAVMAKAKEAK
jgi:aerobic-type carbon monoxide dehydrogenase small subunit (CoxS/CutS family)